MIGTEGVSYNAFRDHRNPEAAEVAVELARARRWTAYRSFIRSGCMI